MELERASVKGRLRELVLLSCYGVSGLACFTYEILWNVLFREATGSPELANALTLGVSMAGLAAGNLLGGCDQDGRPRMTSPDTHPEATVRLQTFYMDLTEVTNAEYAECVTAGKCRKAGPTYRDFSAPRQPVTGVSWFDSVSDCTFRGKHLPTEGEWEKAARGPDGEVYPWGNQPATCELAVVRDSAGRSCGEKKRLGTGPETGRVLEVGSRPAGRYGLYDMIGNAEEWVFDWYSESYAACGADCLGVDPRGPCTGKSPCKGHCYRVVRGGSWYWPASHATGYHRRPHFPDNGPKRFHHFGFRCAASVEEARKIKQLE